MPRSGKKEPTLDEVLWRGTGEAEESVDPALVARLEAWFGPLGVPEEEKDDFTVPAGFIRIEDTPEEEWRRARALEQAEASRLHADIEARSDERGALVEPLPPMEVSVDPSIARFDLARWGVRTAADPQERMIPEDLFDAMRERVPQALLRDLHRPVPETRDMALEPVPLGPRTGAAELGEVRALIRTRYRADFRGLIDTRDRIREAMADLRRRVDDEPWEDARPENPAPFPSAAPTADIMRWFAGMGDNE